VEVRRQARKSCPNLCSLVVEVRKSEQRWRKNNWNGRRFETEIKRRRLLSRREERKEKRRRKPAERQEAVVATAML
jgi:hypothetical protein